MARRTGVDRKWVSFTRNAPASNAPIKIEDEANRAIKVSLTLVADNERFYV